MGEFPDKPTPELIEVFWIFSTTDLRLETIAECFETAGHAVPAGEKYRHAFGLHFLVKHALGGAGWRERAHAELEELRQQALARPPLAVVSVQGSA